MPSNRPWRWLGEALVLAVHDQQIAEHGGSPGVRDMGLLQSALARPSTLAAYRPEFSVFDLAAAYAYGLVRNHPFVDGNKRIGFIAAAVFLLDNGDLAISAPGIACVQMTVALAAGEISGAEFASWLRAGTTLKR